ncbi:MAG: 6,7-dimethyl-8-ribityllumazine synthase [Kiloniellales bacterium]
MDDQPHVLIVESRFYEDIADELVQGAVAELGARKATYERVAVPGAFEIPAAIRYSLRAMDFVGGRRRYDAYVALGCVIRGETTHYDHVCQESARGIADLALTYSLAIGYGILTCENREQVWARAAVDKGNRGGAAARAAMQMVEVKRQFGLYPR